jgi:hypothetical protein
MISGGVTRRERGALRNSFAVTIIAGKVEGGEARREKAALAKRWKVRPRREKDYSPFSASPSSVSESPAEGLTTPTTAKLSSNTNSTLSGSFRS